MKFEVKGEVKFNDEVLEDGAELLEPVVGVIKLSKDSSIKTETLNVVVDKDGSAKMSNCIFKDMNMNSGHKETMGVIMNDKSVVGINKTFGTSKESYQLKFIIE